MVLRSERVAVASGIEFEVLSGGDGPWVLYLHPETGVAPTDRFANALARRFSVLAPRSPGFDDTSIADVHDLAFAYDDLLSVMRIRAIDVIGHSSGAVAAAELAAHSPHRVDRLALIAPVGSGAGLARRLYRLSMPTLLLWGADDDVAPAQRADDLAAAIEDATVRIIANAGHLVTVEQTKKVLDALSRHFAP
jgi:pimeloyl-ACP methyl ester carboxylesterase